MVVASFTNTRICEYSSTDPMFQDSELPAHFTASAEMKVSESALGKGTVSVTNRRVVFVPESQGQALSFDYRSMVMHAVTSDETGKHIFVQLLTDEEDEIQDEILKLIPVSEDAVQPLFEAINEMSALNPDETLSEDGEFDHEESELDE